MVVAPPPPPPAWVRRYQATPSATMPPASQAVCVLIQSHTRLIILRPWLFHSKEPHADGVECPHRGILRGPDVQRGIRRQVARHGGQRPIEELRREGWRKRGQTA